MLAGSAEDLSEALEDLGEAALEFKMDGARVQVHRSGDDVVVYSRALNDVTAAVPEVVEAVRALPAKDLILDGEVLSLQPDGRPQPLSSNHAPVRGSSTCIVCAVNFPLRRSGLICFSLTEAAAWMSRNPAALPHCLKSRELL